MASKKAKASGVAASKKMNTQRMSSTKNAKMTPAMEGGKTIPPTKKGKWEASKKETFNSPKKLKKKTN